LDVPKEDVIFIEDEAGDMHKTIVDKERDDNNTPYSSICFMGV